MTLDEILKAASDKGVPSVLLVVVVWAVFRVARVWAKPLAEKVAEAVVDHVRTLTKTFGDFSEVLKGIMATLAEFRREVKEGLAQLDDRLDRIENGSGKPRTRHRGDESE